MSALDTISLADAKQHLRVEHGEDDALITRLIEASYAHLDGEPGILGRNLADFTDGVPAPLQAAMLLHVGELYDNRDMSQTTQTVTNTTQYKALVDPYRVRFVG